MHEVVALLGSLLEVEVFACGVYVHCCLLCVIKRSQHLHVWLLNSLLAQDAPNAAVFNCVECLLEVNGCDPKCLVPFGGHVSELLECVQVVRRGAAWSEACLVDRLLSVLCGL